MQVADFIVAAGDGSNANENSGNLSGDGSTANGGFVNPADAISGTISSGGETGTDQSSGSGKRGRGRPRGSKNGQAPQASTVKSGDNSKRPVDAEGIAALLMTIHLGISAITKTPELNIEKDEAERLARATEQVAKHYKIEATEKALAWTNLVMACGYVYGTRIIAISARRTTERLVKEQEGNATPSPPNVFNMRP